MPPGPDILCAREGISCFAELPAGFSTEARALGASLKYTESGIPVSEPLFDRVESLLEIGDISASPTVREVLELVRRNSAERPVMLNVQSAYSVLRTATEQRTLYSWLIRNRSEVHSALNSITSGLAGYITEALRCGGKVISISDPWARVEIIGENRYREYAAEYQIRLLRLLKGISVSHGVIHVCPHCSLRLEKYGYVAARRENFEQKPYQEVLLEAASDFVIVGHICIHSPFAEEFYRLEIV